MSKKVAVFHVLPLLQCSNWNAPFMIINFNAYVLRCIYFICIGKGNEMNEFLLSGHFLVFQAK